MHGQQNIKKKLKVNFSYIEIFSSYHTVNIIRLDYRQQSVNYV